MQGMYSEIKDKNVVTQKTEKNLKKIKEQINIQQKRKKKIKKRHEHRSIYIIYTKSERHTRTLTNI